MIFQLMSVVPFTHDECSMACQGHNCELAVEKASRPTGGANHIDSVVLKPRATWK